MFTRNLALILFLLLIPQVSIALPSPADTWIRVDTEHFTLISNAGKGKTVEIGKRLEQFRTVLVNTSVNMSVESPISTYVYVFKATEDFSPYRPGEFVAGYYVPSLEANFIAIDATSEQDPFRVIFHEYVHFWLDQNVPGVPLWLMEGMAEFYSTFDIEGTGLLGGIRTVTIGHLIQDHAFWLQQREHLPLDELLTIDSSSLDYNEGLRTGSFYSLAWALTHSLLMGDDETASRLNDYVARTSSGAPPLETYLEIFDTDLESEAERLREYTEKGRYRYWKFEIAKDIEVEDSRVRELTYSEALQWLGELLTHVKPLDLEGAIQHQSMAVKENPGNAKAHALLAGALYRSRRPEPGREHLDDALRSGAGDPDLFWLAGTAILEWTMLGHDDSPDPDSEIDRLQEAAGLFERALDLDPHHYAAKVGLGRTFRFGNGDARRGAELLEEAYHANPSRIEVLVDWILMESEAGETDKAWDLVKALLRPRGDALAVSKAEYALARAEINSARQLFAEGNRAKAAERLQVMATRTRNPQVREMALSWGAGLIGATNQQNEIEAYNKIVAMANAGETEAALTELEALIPALESERLKTTADDFAKKLRARSQYEKDVELYNRAVDLVRAGRNREALAALRELLAGNPEEKVRDRAHELAELLEKQ